MMAQDRMKDGGVEETEDESCEDISSLSRLPKEANCSSNDRNALSRAIDASVTSTLDNEHSTFFETTHS